MSDYTINLALLDFVPVLLSGVGLFFIAQMIARLDKTSGRIASVAAIMIVLGGLTKAVWKLIFTGSGTDIVWMNNSLFWLLGPGFTLLAWALWNGQQRLAGKAVPQRIWLRPTAVILLFGLGAMAARLAQPQARTWFFILLTLTTIANTAVAILLIKQSRRQGLNGTAVLFLVNILAVFILSGLARMPEQTAILQWIEEGINALSQAAWAIAAWQLNRATQAAVGPPSIPDSVAVS